MLTLGTGVGGGVISNGQVVHSWTELGHMVIVEGGEPCQGACTGHGHVEAYCSGRAADKIAREVLGAGANAHDLVAQQHPALDRDRRGTSAPRSARSSTSSARSASPSEAGSGWPPGRC